MSAEDFIAYVKRNRSIPATSARPTGVRLRSAEGSVARQAGLELHPPDFDRRTLDSMVADVASAEETTGFNGTAAQDPPTNGTNGMVEPTTEPARVTSTERSDN